MKLVPLSRGLEAQVSDEDFERVAAFEWYANPGHTGNGRVRGQAKYYARCNKAGYMHRFIMNYPAHKVVDHIDGNTLNNQRENLQILTHAENMARTKRPSEEPFL